MKIEEVFAEIASDPLARGYAQMNDEQLWASLTEKNRTRLLPEYHISELGVLRLFGAHGDAAAGEVCLQKLEAAAAANPLLKRALGWVKPGAPGLDMADPTVRATLDALHTANVLTTEEVGLLKGVAEVSVSRLEELDSGDMDYNYFIYLKGLRG